MAFVLATKALTIHPTSFRSTVILRAPKSRTTRQTRHSRNERHGSLDPASRRHIGINCHSPFSEQPFRYVAAILVLFTPGAELGRAGLGILRESQLLSMQFELGGSRTNGYQNRPEKSVPTFVMCSWSDEGLRHHGIILHRRALRFNLTFARKLFQAHLAGGCVYHCGQKADHTDDHKILHGPKPCSSNLACMTGPKTGPDSAPLANYRCNVSLRAFQWRKRIIGEN